MGGGKTIRQPEEKSGDCPQGEALRTLLERALKQAPAEVAKPPGFRDAAVLVPLAASGELLLTVRTESLPSHAGQIAFPGGSLEGGESAEEAALREAQEEVSLPPKIAKPLGRLPAVLSPHGFYVQPVVAWLPDKPALTANPDEVSQILWAPLSELAQSSSWSELRRRGDFERLVWHYPWRDRDVWGLTANVLHELLERCRQARTSGGSR